MVLDKIIDKLNIGSKAKRKAGLKSGGRASFKHGKYVKVPTPHADIAKYVEKDSSKSPEHFRKEGSTLKMGKKRVQEEEEEEHLRSDRPLLLKKRK